jgi:hypothetical protein
MRTIESLQLSLGTNDVSIDVHHKDAGGSAMKSGHQVTHSPRENKRENKDEVAAASSRLTDEKIFDESGAETNADRALAPAALDNPFWN